MERPRHPVERRRDAAATEPESARVPQTARARVGDGPHRLTDDQIRCCVRRWQRDGDRQARDRMVSAFLPLARRLAHKYATALEPIEDLIQVASVGLLGSIDRYDPEREAAFVSFAVPTILGELKRHFRDTGWSAHVPRRAQELALRVERAARELSLTQSGAPTATQIAASLGIGIEDVLLGLQAGRAHLAAPFEASADGGDFDCARSVAERTGAEDDGYDMVEAKLSVGDAIERLPYQQRRAVGLRMSGHLKQREIATVMGCSQMHVSRLLRDVRRSLRDATDPQLESA